MKSSMLMMVVFLGFGMYGCSSNPHQHYLDNIAAAEQLGDPKAVADILIPDFKTRCKKGSIETAEDYWGCRDYAGKIGYSLYLAERYEEAGPYILEFLRMNRALTEQEPVERQFDLIQCDSLLSFSGPLKDTPSVNSRLAMYDAFDRSGNPTAKDVLAMAYLCQHSNGLHADLGPAISDEKYIADLGRHWNVVAQEEARFYINNIQKTIAQTASGVYARSAAAGGEDGWKQSSADMAAVYINAYDYALQNNLSSPYLEFLKQQYEDASR